MIVFTMPSYDLVFKVIRDVFGPTKTVTRSGVIERYRFVFEHDRAGPPRRRAALRAPHASTRTASSPRCSPSSARRRRDSVVLDGDRVVIRHLYTERRVTPLNLYLREAPEDARARGRPRLRPGAARPRRDQRLPRRHAPQELRDDPERARRLLRLRRALPAHRGRLPRAARGRRRARRGEASFYVGPRDVFPQEFIHFFGFPRRLRELFVRVHGDLLQPAWWNRMKERHLRGEILDVYPYKPARRLHGRYPGDGDDPERRLR